MIEVKLRSLKFICEAAGALDREGAEGMSRAGCEGEEVLSGIS